MNKKKNVFKSIIDYQQFGLLIALVMLLICAEIFAPAFFSFQAISAMLSNNAIYAIMAVGIMFVLLTGEIDISIGSILAISSVCVTQLMIRFPNLPVIIFICVGMLTGMLCGAVNGFFVGKLKIVSMIVTLSTMYIFRGFAFVISGGKWITPGDFPQSFTAVSQYRIFGINAIVFWAVATFAITALFLSLTRPGRRMYAVGSSEESAVISGIKISDIKLLSYILCGTLAGLSGVLYAANYASVNSEIASGYEMNAIAICILGGVSISGGRGRIDGVVISTLFMSVLTYLLSMLPGFSIWQNALQGVLILIAIAVNLLNNRLTAKRALNDKEAQR